MKPGEQIQGRYTLESPLGEGGMAEVWRARDENLNRQVAVKFLAPQLVGDPEFLVRFFSEAQTVARISHPNVVQVLDFGQHDERPVLIMEYVPGGSLADLKGERITQERAFEIVQQVADGVGAAHQIELVHRDIKPGNILLTEDGVAKIADFGISSNGAAERMTATGAAIGSPHFISPEQVLGKPASPASDVYSLGIVLYELLTGRRPFEGDNITAVAIAHVDKIPLAPGAIDPEIEPWVDSLVMRCLDKDPGVRFKDGNALAHALRTAQPGDYVPSALVGAPNLDPEDDTWDADTASRPPGRILVGAGLILLLALGAAGMMAARRDSPPDRTPAVTQTEDADKDGGPKKKGRRPSPSASPSASAAGGETAVTEPTEALSPTPGEKKEGKEGGADGSGKKDEPKPEPEPEPEPEPKPTEEPSSEPTAEPTPDTSPSG